MRDTGQRKERIIYNKKEKRGLNTLEIKRGERK